MQMKPQTALCIFPFSRRILLLDNLKGVLTGLLVCPLNMILSFDLSWILRHTLARLTPLSIVSDPCIPQYSDHPPHSPHQSNVYREDISDPISASQDQLAYGDSEQTSP